MVGNYCCVFRPAFGCLQPFFDLFCSFQTFFSDFTAEINKKWTKKRKFVYSSKLVDMQKLVDSLRGYLEIVFFGWFKLFLMFFSIFRLISVFFVDLSVCVICWVLKHWRRHTVAMHKVSRQIERRLGMLRRYLPTTALGIPPNCPVEYRLLGLHLWRNIIWNVRG